MLDFYRILNLASKLLFGKQHSRAKKPTRLLISFLFI